MRLDAFTLKFFLLLIAQILIWNFLDFSQYITVVFIPGMLLCIPIGRSGGYTMILAFVCGMFADFFCGVLGMTSLALVPVAFARRIVIHLVFGGEVFSRNEDISFKRQSWSKILLAIIIMTAIFLAIYIIADGAGTRTVWFNLIRFASSLVVSSIVSLFTTDILCSDLGEKWK